MPWVEVDCEVYLIIEAMRRDRMMDKAVRRYALSFADLDEISREVPCP